MDPEERVVLQAFERHGNVGIFWYGRDSEEEHLWSKRIVRFRKRVTRPRHEAMAEQQRLLRLGVYDTEDDDSTGNVVH